MLNTGLHTSRNKIYNKKNRTMENTSAIFQKSIKTEKHRSAPVVCLLWKEPLVLKNNSEKLSVMHDINFFFLHGNFSMVV